jgi:hypothetical protein
MRRRIEAPEKLRAKGGTMNVLQRTRRVTGYRHWERNTRRLSLLLPLGTLLVGVVLLLGGRSAQAQVASSATTIRTVPTLAEDSRNPNVPPDPLQDQMENKSKLQRNEERQRKLVSDTDRLLLLANQLKSEIAASGGETMTPQMLHQMDEIEKLARSVKDKMRN